MKEGLHLGVKPPRTRALVGLLVVALVAAALFLGARYLRAREELRGMEAAVAALDSAGDAGAGDVPSDPPDVVSGLRAVLASGALESVPPTDLLRMLERNLPEGVDLDGLSMKVAPPGQSLTLDAVARTASDVTEMQRRLSAEPVVSATSVLDERRGADGRLVVRLSVELEGGRP